MRGSQEAELEGCVTADNMQRRSHGPPAYPPALLGSLPTAQLPGRVGTQTNPKAIEYTPGTELRVAKLRASPRGYEKWLIGGSGPLTWRNAALVGIFVCKVGVYGVSALGAQDETDETSLPSWCLQCCETRRYRRVLQIMGHASLNHRVKSHLV